MESEPLSQAKYEMRMSLNVLNHLGINLYSNIPAVLSEVVANAYDADATDVEISIGDQIITIKDNGHGMTLDDVNNKFLYVGYQRRLNNESLSPKYLRPVMGRKGIGKLSLFSIANNIEVHTIRKNSISGELEKNGFILNRNEIVQQISDENNDGVYRPKDVDSSSFEIDCGTRLIITDFKKNVNQTENYLKRRLARRFTVINEKDDSNFKVTVNGEPITFLDRDYFSKIQFLWLIGNEADTYSAHFSFKKINRLNGVIDSTPFSISGWIGAVEKPSDLDQDSINNNKVSVIVRGKMAQEDILESFNEGGIYATYLIGEINADFLDEDKQEDIATSSRQKMDEEDPRYKALQEHVYKLLKQIQGVWTEYRKELAEVNAVEKAETFNPALKEWFDSLKTDSRKQHAIKLFSTIDTLHFTPQEEKEKKRELYKQGILAFEKLKLRDSLHELDKIRGVDDIRLAAIFTDLSDIEANLYYDIATERVQVIREFQKQLDANDKEKLLQLYLFDNLWLLNPSWERATVGSGIIEKNIDAEFDKVSAGLTPEEKAGRIDIKYRTSAGKHIIVELKRYIPSYNVKPTDLYEQVKKYRNALTKCITVTPGNDPLIEGIIILGKRFNQTDYKEAVELLKLVNARIIYYDDLIDDSLESYKSYLDKQQEVSRIRAIIDKI
jgi:hypothetical protein